MKEPMMCVNEWNSNAGSTFVAGIARYVART
jgi:hypothetical protein